MKNFYLERICKIGNCIRLILNLLNRCTSLRGGTVSVSSLVNLTHPHAIVAAARGKDATAPKAKATKTFNPFDMLDDQ
jgi:hypothetical protein